MEFDVLFTGPEGVLRSETVEANYASEACEFIESTKGGDVLKCEKRTQRHIVWREATKQL